MFMLKFKVKICIDRRVHKNTIKYVKLMKCISCDHTVYIVLGEDHIYCVATRYVFLAQWCTVVVVDYRCLGWKLQSWKHNFNRWKQPREQSPVLKKKHVLILNREGRGSYSVPEFLITDSTHTTVEVKCSYKATDRFLTSQMNPVWILDLYVSDNKMR